MEKNVTAVRVFILLGFQASQTLEGFMFFPLVVVYCFTILMNLLIIALVSTSKNLHTPMYFFLTQLSMNDIILPTDIAPNILYILIYHRGSITFVGCMIEIFFFGFSEASECLLLTVMSYDRYVAICNPLRYTSIMTSTYCVILAVTSWFIGFCIPQFVIPTILQLNFCGPNIIDHFFCDLVPLLELSCSDTYVIQIEFLIFSIPLILIPVIIIIFSYTKIIVTTLRIPSNTGRQKAFSTCSSHLIVVSIFYWTIFGVYVLPTKGKSSTISKILSLLYTVFTPLINPIIYSLKNNDIKETIKTQVLKHLRRSR
ncbi:olfactory receptor 10A7-like [Engystomops pustulosus]|uniref:olfactory receptor 10A7-like n=1 Tax=Engystomops pustulosus TaxID=76066 RepID=UPI003AFAED25